MKLHSKTNQKRGAPSRKFRGKNAFGAALYSPRKVLGEKKIENAVCSMLMPVLRHLGFGSMEAGKIISQCVRLAKKCGDITEYEERAHGILEKAGVTRGIPAKLEQRAELMLSQIAPYLKEGKICDYGCGDGRLGKLLAEFGSEVELCDVYENSNVEGTGLRFKKLSQEGQASYADGKFDSTLALTVWHHCDNPEQVMDETARITREGGRVIAIESVYGVQKGEVEREELQAYLSLTEEQQRKVNIFFDHFYNRVIHYSKDSENKVNVPFNFSTPIRWKELLEKRGFEVEIIHLGIDQPAVPEYHVLIVATKLDEVKK